MIKKYNGKELNIEKLVAEYAVWELYISPYGKFKVRVFYDGEKYTSHTNIMVIDQEGIYHSVTASSHTIEDILDETIQQFFKMTEWKKDWKEEDFDWINPNEF